MKPELDGGWVAESGGADVRWLDEVKGVRIGFMGIGNSKEGVSGSKTTRQLLLRDFA